MFSDLYSVCLKTINHSNCEYLVGILQVLRSDFRKVRISDILNFHPCKIEAICLFCCYISGKCTKHEEAEDSHEISRLTFPPNQVISRKFCCLLQLCLTLLGRGFTNVVITCIKSLCLYTITYV